MTWNCPLDAKLITVHGEANQASLTVYFNFGVR